MVVGVGVGVLMMMIHHRTRRDHVALHIVNLEALGLEGEASDQVRSRRRGRHRVSEDFGNFVSFHDRRSPV